MTLRTDWALRGSCVAGVVIAAVGVSAAQPAWACLQPWPPIALSGFPADGAVGVPTDVVPYYEDFLSRIFDPAQVIGFGLTADSGETIALTLKQSHVDKFDLVPAGTLQPFTRYTLQGHWRDQTSGGSEVTQSLSFTTGAGPNGEALLPPVATMQHYSLQDVSLTSCDPFPHGTCVGIPSAGMAVQMIFVDSFGQEVVTYSNDGLGRSMEGYLQTGPFFIDLSGVDQGTNFECVRLRSRGANAALSAPVTICGRDAPTIVYRGTSHIECNADGLIAHSEGGSIVTPGVANAATGCGVAGSPASGSWSEILVSLLWAALSALGRVVRRRRTAD